MNINRIISFIFLLNLFSLSVKAQIENMFIETYYVSDTADATDTTGGYLEAGSITYRVYVDLKPGSKLKRIYGDAYHPLKISSTEIFFNNKADGESFGKDFSLNRLKENTVALDSWITLGQLTRVSSKTFFGVPKIYDDDGSLVGGINNDGGSALIAGGLLSNNNTDAGIPLTTSDGNDTMVTVPLSWLDYGIIDIASGIDSTIFGSVHACKEFISYNAGLLNSGVSGVNSDSNIVLIAQLTTKGEISLEINLEVEVNDSNGTHTIKFVSSNDTVLTGEIVSPFLRYPPECGCTDARYLEYNSTYGCLNQDSCQTLIVFGCMDTAACNYDPFANYNIESLCCYPGYCNNRDLGVVCPQLNTGREIQSQFNVYPNPANNKLNISISSETEEEVNCVVYDTFGKLIADFVINQEKNSGDHELDVTDIPSGCYFIRFSSDSISDVRKFIIYH